MKMQNSPGGKGASSKYDPHGSGKGSASPFNQNGHPKSASSKYRMTGDEPSFTGKYKEANAKRNRPMINGSSKSSQKGKRSLESAGKDMGEHMYLGKNEHNRA